MNKYFWEETTMKIKRIICALLCLVMLVSVPFAAGAIADPELGTSENIFPPEVEIIEVHSKADFDAMREDPTGYYRLKADLKFTATDFSSDGDFNGGFKPLPTFSGVLDGDCHTISGLQIAGAEDGRTGLFAENKGTICDLRVVDAKVVQDDMTNDSECRVGLFSGDNFGKIIGCSVYGTIEAKSDNSRIMVGTLTGQNSGTIKDCAANATIYVKRNVDSLAYVGGIAGYNAYWSTNTKNYKASIACCYADVEVQITNAGSYTKEALVAKIVGLNQNAVVEKCYYPAGGDTVGKAEYTNSSVDGYVGDCHAVPTDELNNAAGFAALDFEKYWRIGAEPVLKLFPCYRTEDHVIGEEIIVDEAPGCVTAGKGHKACTICGEAAVKDIPIPSTGEHAYAVEVAGSKVAATCIATGSVTMKCKDCTATEVKTLEKDPANHTGGTNVKDAKAATCGKAGYSGDTYCLGCNAKIASGTAIPATGKHSYDKGVVTKEPTTAKEGVKTFTCTVCGATKTEKIAKLPAPKPTVNFVDVKKNDFFYTPVQWAVANGVTTGTGPNTFSPNESCTRAQAVTFLWRAAGEPAVKNAKNPFTDVKKNDYFYKAVLWAAENGVTSGTSATKFSPNDVCTRGQIVTFLWRAQSGKKVTASNPFKDVKKSDFYYNAVLWAVKNGVTTGTSSTTFGPSENCTRGQIVTFLYRAMQK